MSDASNRNALIKAAMKAPYLARDEEMELAVAWKEAKDQQALHRLTEAHMRLVVSMAMKFRNYGLPVADLIQEGHIGLLEAAARFDPGREVRFSTYATWWIRAAIQDYVLRNWSIVRGGTSSTQKALFFNLRRLRAKLMGEDPGLERAGIHDAVSVKLGVPVSEVAKMDSRLSGQDMSLNQPLSADEGAERQDFLVSEAPGPEEIVTETVDTERQTRWLHSALNVLNQRELLIIRKRRLQDEGETLESLGVALGISKERVRQIESRAIDKLRSALETSNPGLAASFGA